MNRNLSAARIGWALGLAALLGACASTTIPDEDDVPAQNADRELVEAPLSPTENEGELAWVRRTPLIVPPIEIQPDSEYRLGPHDVVRVSVDDLYREDETARLDLTVGLTGKIAVPLAGEISVDAMTAEEARTAVAAALGRFLRNPQVSIQVAEYRSKKVHIMGAVRKPSTFFIPKNQITIIEALALASGLSDTAGRNAILVRRRDGGAEQLMIDLEMMLTRGGGSELFVEPGDALHVPEADKVFVIGYVYRPGGYPLQRRMTALELVANAGGAIPRVASPAQTFLRRRKTDGNFRIVRLDLDEISAGMQPDIVLTSGDMVFVPQSGFRHVGNETWDILKGRVGANIPTAPGF